MSIAMPLALVFAALPLAAQTFVVDAAGGAGASFTSIDAAAAAVPDGAVLLVRPGAYTAFTIAGKGLTVLGDAGATTAGCTVTGTTAAQRVVVRGLGFTGTAPFHRIDLTGCAGPVHLQDLGPVPFAACRLYALQCQQLLVERCELSGTWFDVPARLDACPNAVFAQTTVRAGVHTALVVAASRVLLADCTVRGGTGTTPGDGFGIDLLNSGTSVVRLLGATTVAGGPVIGMPGPAESIAGFGSVQRGPAVVLASPIGANFVLTNVPEAALRTTGGVLGTTVAATLSGDAGSLGLLVLGTPGAALAFPGFAGSVWVDPTSAVPVSAAVFGAPLAATVPIPATPQLLGQAFAWQGLVYAAATGFTLSNPGWFTLR